MSDSLTNAPPPPSPPTSPQIIEYLDYAGTALKERRDLLVTALTADAKAHPKIDDDDVLAEIGENMKMRSAFARTADNRRKDEKEPFLTGSRVVDAWFKTLLTPLDTAAAAVQKIADEYAQRKVREAREKAERERKIAAEEERKALEAASEKLRAGQDAQAALDHAATAAEAAEAAEKTAAARAPDLTRTRGVYGAVSSAREKWRWELRDISKVPREYLMVNPDAVKAAAAARDERGKPTTVIPGIDWVVDTKMGFR